MSLPPPLHAHGPLGCGHYAPGALETVPGLAVGGGGFHWVLEWGGGAAGNLAQLPNGRADVWVCEGPSGCIVAVQSIEFRPKGKPVDAAHPPTAVRYYGCGIHCKFLFHVSYHSSGELPYDAPGDVTPAQFAGAWKKKGPPTEEVGFLSDKFELPAGEKTRANFALFELQGNVLKVGREFPMRLDPPDAQNERLAKVMIGECGFDGDV